MAVYPAELEDEREDAARAVAHRAVESVSSELHAEAQLLRGAPEQRLAQEAAEGADLLVLGSRGYGPVKRVLLGSVSTSVVNSASCPLMIVPRTAEFDPSATGLAGADTAVST
jgi:nucleotide-binding universal stress UspA family protein